MPKSVLFLLLATAGVPAMATDEDGGRTSRREAARAERVERAVARAERKSESAEHGARVSRQPELPSVEPRASERRGGDRVMIREERREVVRRSPRFINVESERPAIQRDHADGEPRVQRRGPRMVEVGTTSSTLEPPGVDSVRHWRRGERGGGRSPALVEQRTDSGWEPLRRRAEQTVEGVTRVRRAPMISRVPREGTQPPLRAMAERSGSTAHRWRGDWRSDRRYDWRRHRDRHRSLFRLGFYYDPFGWSYRPYSIGWRLWPSYYHSSYWLHDAWTYRLPYAPPGYRWIRYYDDALLVDTWDGRVVDVIRNFFW